MMMKEMGERVRSLLPSLADFVDCAHSGRTLSCSPRVSPPGYACVMTPPLSEERAMVMMKKAKSVLLASLQTAPAAAKGTWVAPHSWDVGGQQEVRSAAWQETSAWYWSSLPCAQ